MMRPIRLVRWEDVPPATAHEKAAVIAMFNTQELIRDGIPVALDTNNGRLLPNERHYDARLFYRGRKGFIVKFKSKFRKDAGKVWFAYATANGFYKIHVNRASDWRFFRDNEILYY